MVVSFAVAATFVVLSFVDIDLGGESDGGHPEAGQLPPGAFNAARTPVASDVVEQEFVQPRSILVNFADKSMPNAWFEVTEVQVARSGDFRVRLTISNRGGRGPVRFQQAGATAAVMHRGLAQDYASKVAAGNLAPSRITLAAYSALTLIETAKNLPAVIYEGESWSGWLYFRSMYPFVFNDVVEAVVVHIPGAPTSWVSTTREQPYISLR